MRKKLIFLDIDGTIYDNTNKCIHPSTIQTIKECKALGHELVIATGRGYFMLYSIEEIMPYIDHYVLINGQQIIAHGEVIYEDDIDKDEVQKLVESMDKFNVTYGFESATEEAVNRIDHRVIKSFEILNLNIPKENSQFHKQSSVYQMWCFCDAETIEKLRLLHPKFQFLRWLTVGYDIIKQGQSKGNGVKRLGKHLGYNIEDMIAIGDGENDIDMLEYVGLGIAMGNASENVKKASDYVTDDMDKDGIYKAFRTLKII